MGVDVGEDALAPVSTGTDVRKLKRKVRRERERTYK